MYLKSLKLVGFKSFADRTRLEFRPGVTVVVGPNGSGKSNLVDALSWVMGTQATKALRTGKMEDVVFAGTATRPALNRAEATLVIDNHERTLPLDLDEVSITRRLYRDGSSDYEINGVACRLLDIEELLSDSGIGRHQHVIIGQGQVDKVLNASPDDHRAIIEEAAGILKHRRRKEKAERRLERTDEDLVRLRDLLGEIERQMRPLKRQARAAERYDGLKTEVRDLTLYLSGHAIRRYDEESARAAADHADTRLSLSSDEEAVEHLSKDLRRLTELTAGLGADLERDTSAAARLETTMERLRRIGSVAHERSRAATGRREASVARRVDLETERADLEAELGDVKSREEEAAAAAVAREERFRRLEDEERAIATQTSLSPEGAVAAVRGELSVLEAAILRDRQEETAVRHRLEVIEGQLVDERGEIARINDEIRDTDRSLQALLEDYERASERRVADQEAWSAAEEQLGSAKLAQAAAGARVEAITNALDGRFNLEARRQVESASGALGSLVGLLDVPSGLERAVEAALGKWADAVAFSDIDPLRAAVEGVKAAGSGGIPVVSARGEISSPARDIAATSGVDALVDLLGADADMSLATRLLGDVIVVEGWTAAWTLISRQPSLRAVTPEGDLLSINGVQIAHPDGAGVAMLESAEVELERAETAMKRALSIHTAVKRDFENSRAAEREALEVVEKAEAALAGKAEAMSRLQQTVNSLEEEGRRLAVRKGSLGEGQEERSRQISDLTARLEALEGEEAERIRAWQQMEARRLDLAASRELARSDWQESASAARGLTERRRLLEERVKRISDELDRIDGTTISRGDASSLDLVESFARAAVSSLQSRVEELRDRQVALRADHGRAVADLERVRDDYETRRTAIGAAREHLSHLELVLTENRLHRESVVETVRRDADAGAEDAISAPRPDYPEDARLEEILEDRSAQLRRLGPINPLAASEFAELSERHGFLSEQMADVESSRSELRKVISALETTIEERFGAAFSEIAGAYQRYFAVLFPGGRGRIRLTEPDDPHSGVIIDAQPLGKKVSQLTLLSGGERSLAALAFLFAVFEARPSPFYVLDEVEAALDDANLRRFLSIVDEFRRRAQLIIVTHQQQTMEAADVLYGVTMEPGGSSQVVRKDMASIPADRVA